MKKISIAISDKKYNVELAETDTEKEEGLQNRQELKQDEGMLFIFGENEPVSFWMKNTAIPLDIIFIDDELIVTKVYQGQPNSEEFLEGEATYVLEVNQNSGIKIGDELEFEPQNKKVSDKMLVLNSGGEVQMELEGGERIFSRKHTKTLITFAKKAAATENDKDYMALGKRMFKFLQVQSETAPEYVESKN